MVLQASRINKTQLCLEFISELERDTTTKLKREGNEQ